MRGSGILLHISSLPSDFGVGDLGPWAFRFTDFLAQAGQRYWQILPVTPPAEVMGYSPYSSDSAFAGNFFLISPEMLVEDGLLSPAELRSLPANPDKADLNQASQHKMALLQNVFKAYGNTINSDREYQIFENDNDSWLEDYALFRCLKKSLSGLPWTKWPDGFKFRRQDDMESYKQEAAREISFEKFVQYIFFRQWKRLRAYQRSRGIMLIGDAPIYVTHDSADVWAKADLFQLNDHGEPLNVAGVPPDYFSQDGQLWGNPIYDWSAMEAKGFDWWITRLEHNFRMFDLVRLDHFLAFSSYYSIPAEEKTARNGQWLPAKGDELFSKMAKRHVHLPIIAEDLGLVTAAVREMKNKFGFPGMSVLEFGFSGDPAKNPDIPHNILRNCLVYPGTHDNNTVCGWFEENASAEEKEHLLQYIGGTRKPLEIHWEMIRLGMMSAADTFIANMQDILGLGSQSRMNTPSTSSNNWTWRVRREALSPELAQRLKEYTTLYGRL